MQQTILVPLDGSARAEAVLPAAVALGRATGSGLLLLQVVAPTVTPGTWMLADREWEEAEATARAYLELVAGDIRQAGLPVSVEIEGGYPATRIVQVARQDPQVTRIAMATHGQGGMTRLVFGSMAEQVLRATSLPLLLVRDGQPAAAPSFAGGTILVPLDGSRFARQAFDEAQTLARAAGGRLLLVSVLSPLAQLATTEAGVTPYWLIEARQREAARLTRELEKTARQVEATGLRVETLLAYGDPIARLAAIAVEHDVTLIVMATHGRTGVAQILLGSVALGVVRLAPMPVLLVRPLQLMHRRYDPVDLVVSGR